MNVCLASEEVVELREHGALCAADSEPENELVFVGTSVFLGFDASDACMLAFWCVTKHVALSSVNDSPFTAKYLRMPSHLIVLPHSGHQCGAKMRLSTSENQTRYLSAILDRRTYLKSAANSRAQRKSGDFLSKVLIQF